MRDLINIINESQNNPLTKSKKMTLSEYIQQQDIPEEKKMKLIEMIEKESDEEKLKKVYDYVEEEREKSFNTDYIHAYNDILNYVNSNKRLKYAVFIDKFYNWLGRQLSSLHGYEGGLSLYQDEYVEAYQHVYNYVELLKNKIEKDNRDEYDYEERKMKLIEMAKDYDIIKPSKDEKKHYDSLTFSQFVKEIYDTYGYIHIMGSGGIHWLNIKGEIFEYCHEHGLHTNDITAIPYRGDYFIFDNSSANGQ